MEKPILELILETSFDAFDLGDSIQIFDNYIYIELADKNDSDRKFRIPFDYQEFQRQYQKTNVANRQLFLAGLVNDIKTYILEETFRLKEEN